MTVYVKYLSSKLEKRIAYMIVLPRQVEKGLLSLNNVKDFCDLFFLKWLSDCLEDLS